MHHCRVGATRLVTRTLTRVYKNVTGLPRRIITPVLLGNYLESSFFFFLPAYDREILHLFAQVAVEQNARKPTVALGPLYVIRRLAGATCTAGSGELHADQMTKVVLVHVGRDPMFVPMCQAYRKYT